MTLMCISTKVYYKILGVLVSTRTGAMGDDDDPSYSRHHRRRHQHLQHRQYPDSQQHHQSRYNRRDKEEDDDDDDRTEDTGLPTRRRSEAEAEEEEEVEVEEGGCTDRPNSRWCLFVSQARLCGYGHYKRRCCLTCSKYNLHH